MKFSARLREARKKMGLSQAELADKIGSTQRTITSYENGKSMPTPTKQRKIADALNVTVEYLMQDDSPKSDIIHQQEIYINEAREKFGARGAKEMADLLTQNIAFFAGGDVDESAKDQLFNALAYAYFACKQEASHKFGRDGKNSDED